MPKKSTPFLERIARNLGSLFVVIFVLAAIALAATTWPSGNAPVAAPGSGNVVLTAGLWQANATNAFYNGGNVGIGTNTPAELLSIKSASYPTILIEGTGTEGGDLMLKSNTGSWQIYSEGSDLRIWDTQDRITIKAGGNVGIGTTTPSTKLEIVGGLTKTTGGLIIETRTSDPTSPVTGQIWLRTDI